MATHLDLEEQEQLDQLKSFWKQYGNLITWLLIVVLGAYAAWNGWNWWQRDQAVKAAAMYDELDRAAQAGDADKAGRVFADMKERFARTTFTAQGALLAARTQFEKGQPDNARGAEDYAHMWTPSSIPQAPSVWRQWNDFSNDWPGQHGLVESIPEPSSFWLLAIGIVLVVGYSAKGIAHTSAK